MSRAMQRAFGLSMAALAMSGCLFAAAPVSFDRQTQQLQTHIDTLNIRMDRLESARTVGAAPAAPGTFDSSAALAESGMLTESESFAGNDVRTPGTAPERRSGMAFRPAGAMTKLLRGVVNLATGWVELPKKIHQTAQDSGAGTAATYGLLRGVGHTFVRTLAGAYEIITFPFPAPTDYRPVIRPSYVFLCD